MEPDPDKQFWLKDWLEIKILWGYWPCFDLYDSWYPFGLQQIDIQEDIEIQNKSESYLIEYVFITNENKILCKPIDLCFYH